MNLEKARFNMIEQQVRPWNVSDERVRQLLAEVPREAFAPAKYRDLAFADIELPLLDDETLARQRGQVMLEPRVQARLVQELALRGGENVLHVGAGSGFVAALLAGLAARVTTLEIDNAIAELAATHLQRAGVGNAEVVVADAASVSQLPQGPFDAILLDAPCSASGISRRHPDARWLRRESDIAQLARMQTRLLEALWPLLAVGGRLLYATCSVFDAEGQAQITRFLQRRPQARPHAAPGYLLPDVGERGEDRPLAFPDPAAEDGFFYALFEKSAA